MGLHKLARLGDYGKHKGNVHRDLLALLGEPSTPEAIHAPIPCRVAKAAMGESDVKPTSMPFNCPHLVMEHLWQHHKERFDDLFFGGAYDKDLLTDFWKEVTKRRDPRVANHPMCMREGWAERAIPIVIHGDAVPCVGVGKSGSKSFDCYSIQSVCARGSSARVKLYLFGIFEDCKVKPSPEQPEDTLKECWRVALWSLRAAFEGKAPAVDCDGRACTDPRKANRNLADGFFLVIWGVKGDLDFYAKGLFLRHYARNEFCEFCPATTHGEYGMTWNNFNKNATWKSKIFTKTEWHAIHPHKHWLFDTFDFLTQHNLEPYPLHILWLGVVPLMLGNVLWVLCYLSLPDDPQSNLRRVWAIIAR
jgi:hypothetical protein